MFWFPQGLFVLETVTMTKESLVLSSKAMIITFYCYDLLGFEDKGKWESK